MRKCRAFPSGYAKIMPNDIDLMIPNPSGPGKFLFFLFSVENIRQERTY
ncbi:Uncharacterized protein dnm_067430 [Desulfonema magnum]|uniref:Uncharacterized protein n=1 Tax=Desulfonema magnum TaxID=45655 RepID=A0A975BS24_9BACT|nr:Uncharacterized protein dnm_067430 [Desulfonema magnum]